MLILKKIAVTGTIASGKTTICRVFEKYGAYVISTDKIVHDLLSPDTSVGKKIIDLLGIQIVNKNQINREKISELVFSNNHKLKRLEQILHPVVRETIQDQFQKIKNQESHSCFVVEIPLLIESGMEKDFDIIILVKTKKELAQKRFKGSYFEERLKRQKPISEKQASFVINNVQDMKALESLTQQIIKQL